MKVLVKLVVSIISVFLFFASCSKPKDFTASYLRGKINGIGFECNANISANSPEPLPGRNDPTVRILGEWSMYAIKLFILAESTSITVGTYDFQGSKQRSATIQQNNREIYYAGNGGFADPIPLHGSGKITIDEISKGYIKGRFDFITGPVAVTNDIKTVTDGEFYVERK